MLKSVLTVALSKVKIDLSGTDFKVGMDNLPPDFPGRPLLEQVDIIMRDINFLKRNQFIAELKNHLKILYK